MTTELYSRGKDAFPVLLHLIQTAQRSLEIQMFIWRNDEIGVLLGQAVLDAARRGVRVVLSKDLLGVVFEYSEESRGSFFHGRPPRRLSAMAACLHWAYPVARKPTRRTVGPHVLARELLEHPLVTAQTTERQNNHSKYFLVDDSIFVLSGMNIEDKEWKQDLQGRAYWDFLVVFRDPRVVNQFRQALVQAPAVHRDLAQTGSTLDFVLNTKRDGKMVFSARESLLDRLEQARQDVVIVMAYIGDGPVQRKLQQLTARGVRVRVFLPESANLQNDLNRKKAKALLRGAGENLEIWLCRDMIHAKLLLIDGDYVTVGSTNLNRQALSQLGETNVGFFSSALGLREPLLEALAQIQERSYRVEQHRQLRYHRAMARLESLV